MDPFPLTGTIVVILSNRNSIVHIHVNATEVVHVHVNVNVNVNALKLQRKLGTAVVVQGTTKLPYVYTIVLQLVNNYGTSVTIQRQTCATKRTWYR